MAKQVILSEKQIIDGVEVTVWEKQCPYCHKFFKTTSRRQKFCSEDCCKKYNKRQKAQRTRYSKVKEVERLRVRSHALAVAVMDQLAEMHVVEKKCAVCGETEVLELHHIDANFLNNTPSNLVWLCRKHHAEAHSKLEKDLGEKGILLCEFYEPSMQPFMKVLNENSK